MKRSLAEQFWSHVKVGKPGECWEWIGNSTQPIFRNRSAARFALLGEEQEAPSDYFSDLEGIPIEELEVCHTCDNPRCMNPNHLFLGTHLENMQDSIQKHRLRFR